MTDNVPVTVYILDKEYQVSCPESECDALQASAQFLDEKMRKIRDSGKVVGIDRIAVMAALNIVNEMFQQESRMRNDAHSVTTRLEMIQSKIDAALGSGQLL